MSNFFGTSTVDNPVKGEVLESTSPPDDPINKLFPKYLIRLQHNFFVSLLFLNIFFNFVVITFCVTIQVTEPLAVATNRVLSSPQATTPSKYSSTWRV